MIDSSKKQSTKNCLISQYSQGTSQDQDQCVESWKTLCAAPFTPLFFPQDTTKFGPTARVILKCDLPAIYTDAQRDDMLILISENIFVNR